MKAPPKEHRLLSEGLLDLSNDETLGLKPLRVESAEIFHATDDSPKYNHHPYIAYFKKHFYAMWSSGPVDEDSSAQQVVYATSSTGREWTRPALLAKDPDGPDGPLRLTAAGWLNTGQRLYGLFTVNAGPGTKRKWEGKLQTMAMATTDGVKWQEVGTSLDDFLVASPPQRLSDNHWAITGTDAIGQPIFVKVEVSSKGNFTESFRTTILPPLDGAKLVEMAYYGLPAHELTAIFRDDHSSNRLYTSESADLGKNWSRPERTNFPDARSKSLAGCFPGGAAFIIGNPAPKKRYPLVLSISFDGKLFEHMFVVRHGKTAIRYLGANKGLGFQYPSAVLVGNSLWVIYSINKEDIAATEIPLESIAQELGFSVSLLSQPASQWLKAGKPAVLSFEVKGLASMKFLWQRNGFPVAITGHPELHISRAGSLTAGIYTVEIESLGKKIESKQFSISVTP